jgi:hypothetical protein
MVSKQEEDCPISQELCKAYREGLEEKIKSIKDMIKTTSVLIVTVVGIIELALKLWRP